MNRSPQMHLKIIVERAVRPLQINTVRKLRMREELLAHLTAVYDAEAEKGGDEHAALERTKRRFGNPDELSGQLQESVPTRDFSERLMDGVVVLTLLWFALFWGAEFPEFSGRIVLEVCLFAVGLLYLGDLLRRAWNGPAARSTRRAFLIASGSVLLFAGLFYFSLERLGDPWSKPKDISNIFMIMAVLTWGLVTPIHETFAQIRSRREWDDLPIH
jgi:hypothetical protein